MKRFGLSLLFLTTILGITFAILQNQNKLYRNLQLDRTFQNGRKLYYDPKGGSYPYVLEGNPNTHYPLGMEFVDNDEDLETSMVLSKFSGQFVIDVREGWPDNK